MSNVNRRSKYELLTMMPPEYDNRTDMAIFRGNIIISHPELPPLRLINDTWVKIEPHQQY